MQIAVESLTQDETNKFAQLIDLFGEVFDDSQNYHSNRPTKEYLERFLADGAHIVLAAIMDGRVVGGLVAYVITKFEMERKEVFIYDLAVSGNYQRRGVGRSLMDKLKIVARDKGAYVIFVQADEGDEAIKFYESLNPDVNLRTRNFDYLV
jgi:aminoglycoside 3-N-acetyltransferase I